MSGSSTTPRQAFSLIELLVVIAIIAMLAAMLLPAIKTVRATARAAVCASNLHQIAIAAASYQADWRFIMGNSANACPPTWDLNIAWCAHAADYFGYAFSDPETWLVKPASKSACSRVFTCPEQPLGNFGGNWSSYNMNNYGTTYAAWYGAPGRPRTMSSVTAAGTKVYLLDWGGENCADSGQFVRYWNFYTFDGHIAARHRKQCNILFMDGHVKAYGAPALPIFSTTDGARVGPWIEAAGPGSPDF